MMRNAEPTDWTGELFEPWAGSTSRPLKRPRTLERGESVPITVARLGNGRHILERVSEQECDAGDRHQGRDVGSCRGGINVDLFPATTLYIRATVVDPLAVRWDPGRERYVRGVESRIYYQVGGRHPDLNRNEVDDAIDIALKTSEDRNGDGVPDEAQRDRQP